MEALILLTSGLLLGLTHAFEPDHLAAVSSFTSYKKSAKYGFIWGLGHTLALFITTLLVLLFKFTLTPTLFEAIVGLVLIFIGARLLLKKSIGHTKHQFAVGLLHGLAGTAALIVLMASVTTTIWYSMFFVAIFGVGSIIGMYAMSFSLTAVLRRVSSKVSRSFVLVTAVASIGIGIYKIIPLFL